TFFCCWQERGVRHACYTHQLGELALRSEDRRFDLGERGLALLDKPTIARAFIVSTARDANLLLQLQSSVHRIGAEQLGQVALQDSAHVVSQSLRVALHPRDASFKIVRLKQNATQFLKGSERVVSVLYCGLYR